MSSQRDGVPNHKRSRPVTALTVRAPESEVAGKRPDLTPNQTANQARRPIPGDPRGAPATPNTPTPETARVVTVRVPDIPPRGRPPELSALAHLAEKNSVYLEDFAEALRLARRCKQRRALIRDARGRPNGRLGVALDALTASSTEQRHEQQT